MVVEELPLGPNMEVPTANRDRREESLRREPSARFSEGKLLKARGGGANGQSLGRLAARLGDPRKVGVRGFFLYGLAYGAASLRCTLPAFLAVVGSGIAAGGVVPGAVRFVGYGLGIASVLVTLTVALAFFKEGLVKWLRGALPYVRTASALLLILAGAYVVFYRWTA